MYIKVTECSRALTVLAAIQRAFVLRQVFKPHGVCEHRSYHHAGEGEPRCFGHVQKEECLRNSPLSRLHRQYFIIGHNVVLGDSFHRLPEREEVYFVIDFLHGEKFFESNIRFHWDVIFCHRRWY